MRLLLHILAVISAVDCRLYGESDVFFHPPEFPEFAPDFVGFRKYLDPSETTPSELFRMVKNIQGMSASELARRFCQPDWDGVSEDCATNVRDFNCGLVDFFKAFTKNCQEKGTNLTDCQCQQQKNAAMTKNLWTVAVIDAFGKIPSAILYGDFQWIGTYSACVKTQVKIPVEEEGAMPRHWGGKYCTASFAETVSDTTAYFTSKCTGTNATGGCKPPSMTSISINIGVCLPDTCSENDINTILNTELTRWGIKVCNARVTCQDGSKTSGSSTGFGFVMLVCAIILLLMACATIFDVYIYQPAIELLPEKKQEQPNQAPGRRLVSYPSTSNEVAGPEVTDSVLSTGSAPSLLSLLKTKAEYYNELAWYWKSLLAFSIYTNGAKLLTAKTSGDDLSCIHGIRFLSMAWVILGHVFYFVVRFMDNTKEMMEYPKMFSWQVINNATVSVDTFFVLSGFLLSYLFLKKITKPQLKSVSFWIMYYVHRFIRLTPTYMLILAVSVTVFPRLGEGPMWRGSQEGVIKNCYRSWWSNLFYLNNFFYVKSEQMCMGWTWYLADDMQFYVFAPILLVLFFLFPLIGLLVSVVLMVISALARAIVVVNNNYPPTVTTTVDPSVFYGLEAFGRNVYFKPYMRWSTFILGVMLGYGFWRTRGKLNLSRAITFLIWILTVAATVAVIFGLYGYASGETDLSGTVRGLYAAVNRPLWGAAVCMIIYLCLQGHGGLANTFLSWKIWVPLSRLTYCAYLIHPFVILYFYSTLQRPEHAETFNFVYHFLATMVITYGISLLASLAFESPVIQLEKLWMDPKMWKKREQPSTGFEPVRDRLTEVRFQLQEGLKKMQMNRERAAAAAERAYDIEMETPNQEINQQNDLHKETTQET